MVPQPIATEPRPYDEAAIAEGQGDTASGQPVVPQPRPLQLPVLAWLREPGRRVILASASPRRKELLGQIGLTNLEILPSTIPENLSKTALGPFEYVAATARQKSLEVYRIAVEQASSGDAQQTTATADPDVVIAADTVVVTSQGQILEKPQGPREHVQMLRRLRDSGWHRVLTSVCVAAPRDDARHPGYVLAQATVESKVWFVGASGGDEAGRGGARGRGEGEWRGALTDDVIEAYVATQEGADKAGGYAVQGIGGLLLVERIDGPVDNVVGLPVRRTLELVERAIWRQDEGSSDGEDSDEG